MSDTLTEAQTKLRQRLDADDMTRDLAIQRRGKNLVLARQVEHQSGEHHTEFEDRVRFTQIGPSLFGLSVKRHTGRWEQTPFSGTIDDLVDVITTVMQHLVGAF